MAYRKKKKHDFNAIDKSIRNRVDNEFVDKDLPVQVDTQGVVKRGKGKRGVSKFKGMPIVQRSVDERRKQIYMMDRQGVPTVAICQMLGVTKAVLERDRGIIKKQLKDTSKHFDKDEYIGDTLQLLDALETQAFQAYSDTEFVGVKERLAALKILKDIRASKTKFLQEIGLLEKKGEKAIPKIDVTVLNQWAEQSKDQITRVLVNDGLPAPVEPELDPEFVIEGEYVEKNNG